MTEKSPKTIPVSSGAEAFLAQMKELGAVRYMFANTGTDHGPLIEAMAKTAKEDPRDIQPIVVPHEMAAVSMAHGYYNVTQKPRAFICSRKASAPLDTGTVVGFFSVIVRILSGGLDRASARPPNCVKNGLIFQHEINARWMSLRCIL